jgi:catechol 2,3-dioxygenase-like lactoylglutathione lyase family enzyme
MPHLTARPGPHLAFHHLGLAVRRPQEATAFLSALGYQIGETVFDPGQNVHLAICTHETEPAVEIIWPGDTQGPIEKLTERHAAGIVYHVCYETDNLTAALAQFAAAKLRIVCISPPTPAPLFGGRPVSFYNVVGIGLIEILQRIVPV